MALQEEIEQRSKEIHTENLGMSIGEMMSMYSEGDLDIHPEFQRFYRWSDYQKSRLIESVLLNIPIPSIFVAQREDGVWDVVDGLQRLSTILEFTGNLKDENGHLKAPLVLQKTTFLPSLENKIWNVGSAESFTEAQQRYFKRSRLSFVIVQKESDSSSKYELFQRLNTGGSSLTPQEVRNCLLVMTNPTHFDKLKSLAEFEPFLNSINISDKNLDEQYEKDLVTRFLVLKNADISVLSGIVDLSSYLDEQIVNYFETNISNWGDVESLFKRTFTLINDNIGEDAFKRYNPSKDSFYGGFIVSAFEMVALNLANNIDYWESRPQEILSRIKACWTKITADGISWKGFSASGRLPKTISVGREIFNESQDA